METAKKPLQIIDTSTEVSLQEKAFLVQGSKRFPIHAERASKYSLLFRYIEDQHFSNTDGPVNLLFKNNGTSVELGPCRILKGPNLDGHSGRIVFTQDVYDLEYLFSTNKIKKLQASFSDLPLVLARKEKIHHSFKEYTADLSFDLTIYKKLFDDLDIQYHEEPDEIKESVQGAIFESEGQKFMGYLDKKVEELNDAVADLSQAEHQSHGFYLRKQLWEFLLCCPLMARTNLKPRGYAGDSEMMRMIYFNDYRGNSSFAKLMHKHAVETPAAQSVRNRLKLITRMLKSVHATSDLEPGQKLKVMSVGCGPALELPDILTSPQDCDKYHFVFLDQDSTALSEAADLVRETEYKLDSKIKADYFKGSVRTMLSPQKIIKRWGHFDFIYSLGLFDYLTDPVAKAVLSGLCELLTANGEIVLGNFHVSNRSRYHMEYWGDWSLLHRSEEDLKNLIQDGPAMKSRLFFEDTRNQMFLHIKNRQNGL